MAHRHPQRRRPALDVRRARVGVGRLSLHPHTSGERGDAALHSAPALDLGAAPARPAPIRTCVGCRTRSSVDDLLRVVVEDGALVPDPRRRLPGRGAWLHPVLDCLRRAERRSAFPRALRVPGPLDTGAVRQHLIAASGAREVPGPTEEESKVDPS
ncbi:MAG TPA: YlxR family protein [Pseudonocardia sp.]|nr:YlxR family protein [Pseudonocardia sp.]